MKYPINISNYIKPYNIQGWRRVFKKDYRATPLGTGSGASRFSSPNKRFTVLYAAASVQTAVCEGIIRDRFEETETLRRITRDEINNYVITLISTKQIIHLIDFTGNKNLYTLGLPNDITGASHHSTGQQFSELAYNDKSVDGILYPSRFLGGVCCVLYDRAVSKLVQPTPKEVLDLAQEPSLTQDLVDLNIVLI